MSVWAEECRPAWVYTRETEIYSFLLSCTPLHVFHSIKNTIMVTSYLIVRRALLHLHLRVAPLLLLHAHTHTPPPIYSFFCHLGLSIKNVLSPESGPIKGRIPGRRADKAYLINKCFTIVGPCAPRHTQPAFLWYLIIHPFHSVREGGEGRLKVSSPQNSAACVRMYVCISGYGQGAAPKHCDMQKIQMCREWHM